MKYRYISYHIPIVVITHIFLIINHLGYYDDGYIQLVGFSNKDRIFIMNISLWSLLIFAIWTMIIVGMIGYFRWRLIFSRQKEIKVFRADYFCESDFYRRLMRAHINCTENLPIFAAIVFIIYATQTQSIIIDQLAAIFIIARIFQSIIHISFIETNRTALSRFLLFSVQQFCMVGMIGCLLSAIL